MIPIKTKIIKTKRVNSAIMVAEVITYVTEQSKLH